MIGLSLLAASFGFRAPAQAQTPLASGLIAFVGQGAERGIWTIDPVSSGLTRLTHGQDYRPRWSPDGSEIVFQRFSSAVSLQSDIYVMNADGSNVQRLTDLGTAFQPAWSPDGSRIVFGSGIGRDSEIFVMNADGTDRRSSRTTGSKILSRHGPPTAPRSPSRAASTGRSISTSWPRTDRTSGG
jgi:dipeptidyl aminopeptidase/acylaminoacyl peptidase